LGDKEHGYVLLLTEKKYGDFELRLKFKVSREHKGNTSIQVRSRYDDKAVVLGNEKGWLNGPQANIDPNSPWRNGLIYDETRTEKLTIVCIGTNIRTFLKNFLVTDLDGAGLLDNEGHKLYNVGLFRE